MNEPCAINSFALFERANVTKPKRLPGSPIKSRNRKNKPSFSLITISKTGPILVRCLCISSCRMSLKLDMKMRCFAASSSESAESSNAFSSFVDPSTDYFQLSGESRR